MACSLHVGSSRNNRLKEGWGESPFFLLRPLALLSALINCCRCADNKPQRCGYWFSWGLMTVLMCVRVLIKVCFCAFSRRSTLSVSEPGSYRCHLHKHKRRLTLKPSTRSPAISEAQQGKWEFPLQLIQAKADKNTSCLFPKVVKHN